MTEPLRVTATGRWGALGYKSIERYTEQPALLRALDGLDVWGAEVPRLVGLLCDAVGIDTPRVHWRRNSYLYSGTYSPGGYGDTPGPAVSLAYQTSVQVVCHEVAHHLHRRDCHRSGEHYRAPFHGREYTLRLDRLALIATDLLPKGTP